MSDGSCSSARHAPGFTLIEVIGALVIFSMGVLMVIQVSGALGTRMRQAGVASELVVLANQRLDSLEAEPFASLTPGTTTQSVTVQGATYQSAVTIASLTPVLKQVDVALTPIGGSGPSYAATSYVSGAW